VGMVASTTDPALEECTLIRPPDSANLERMADVP